MKSTDSGKNDFSNRSTFFQACSWDKFFCSMPFHTVAIYACPILWDSHYNINMKYSSIKIIKFMKVTKINRK